MTGLMSASLSLDSHGATLSLSESGIAHRTVPVGNKTVSTRHTVAPVLALHTSLLNGVGFIVKAVHISATYL